MGKDIAKIVLGGVAGLVIAQAILWWLPAGWRTDPLGLAPRLPDRLAFLAPADLQDDPDALLLDQASIEQEGAGAKDASETKAESTAAGADTTTTDVADNGVADRAARDGIAPEAAAESADTSTPSAKQSGDLIPTEPEEPLGMLNSPKFSARDLRAALEKARVEQDGLSKDVSAASDRTVSRDRAEPWYSALCDLARTMTFVDPSDAGTGEVVSDVQAFFGGWVTDAGYFSGLASLAALGLETAGHDRGIVLAGTVDAIVSSGELYKTHLELADKPQTSISVMSRVNPQQNPLLTYQSGDRVIILGVIVDTPSEYLTGYIENEPRVVWGGLPVVVPHTDER